MAKADFRTLELPEAVDLVLDELKAFDRATSAVSSAALARRLRQRGVPGRERVIMERLWKLTTTRWGIAHAVYVGGADPLNQYEWSTIQQRSET